MGYKVIVSSLPGCVTYEDTKEEAMKIFDFRILRTGWPFFPFTLSLDRYTFNRKGGKK